jgi:hypothetical protein
MLLKKMFENIQISKDIFSFHFEQLIDPRMPLPLYSNWHAKKNNIYTYLLKEKNII